jgi:hypothetical protein
MEGIMKAKETVCAAAGDKIVRFERRPSKRDERGLEAIARFNQSCDLAAKLVWPEIPPPRNWTDQTNEELATLDFEGMPEFRGDGHGCGSPEFREQLEAYFHVLMAATRHALGVLGISRQRLATFATENPDVAEAIIGVLKNGEDHATQILRLLRAAAVREMCGIALSEMEVGGDDDAIQP